MSDEKRFSLIHVLFVAIGIATTIATIVYHISLQKRKISDDKWKEYDECGI